MQTVLLAADRHTPGPLSTVASTPMLPVGDRPLAAHAADAAVAAGTDELVFAVGDDAGRVQSYFGGRYRGVTVTYATCAVRGRPAGALRAVRDRLGDRVVAVDASWFVDAASVGRLFERDATAAVDGAAGGTAADGTWSEAAGNRRVGRGDGGDVATAERAVEAVDAAACALPAAALDAVPDDAESLADVLAAAGVDAPVVAESERSVAVTRPADLLAATALALSAPASTADGASTSDWSAADSASASDGSAAVRVADSATIARGVTLDGPVLVAGGATVERGAVVRGPAVVGPDATVGAGARVEAAVLFEDVVVDAAATVAGGVFGPGCTVGGDASIAGVSGFGDRGTPAFAADGGRATLRYW